MDSFGKTQFYMMGGLKLRYSTELKTNIVRCIEERIK